ncbi:MAG: hypothetical protein MZV65_29670 [Chromatiales bacterium]|nr:hypothetical protein [Chromatiales bacterium]
MAIALDGGRAGQVGGARTSEAYRQEVGRHVAAELAKHALPGDRQRHQELQGVAPKSIGEALLLGSVRDQLQPVVDKAGGVLSSDFAPAIVRTRFALVTRLPLKQTLIDTYGDLPRRQQGREARHLGRPRRRAAPRAATTRR